MTIHPYPIPSNDPARSAMVDAMALLERRSDPFFGYVTLMVRQILGTPIAFISLFSGERQTMLRIDGYELEGTPRETFPKPAAIKGQAGVPEWTAPYTAPPETQQAPVEPPVVITPSQIEILPVSASSGEGLRLWYDWMERRRSALRARACRVAEASR